MNVNRLDSIKYNYWVLKYMFCTSIHWLSVFFFFFGYFHNFKLVETTGVYTETFKIFLKQIIKFNMLILILSPSFSQWHA